MVLHPKIIYYWKGNFMFYTESCVKQVQTQGKKRTYDVFTLLSSIL